MHLIISASLHPASRSRILAREVALRLQSQDREVQVFDLAQRVLPQCDGATAYGDPEVRALADLIRSAESIFVASPVYNYDVNAAIKNAVELTGKAWTDKIVALMLAAGGHGSYMSAMGFANSLMLDFHCLIVPRFVYCTGAAFQDDQLADQNIRRRVEQLVAETIRISEALNAG